MLETNHRWREVCGSPEQKLALTVFYLYCKCLFDSVIAVTQQLFKCRKAAIETLEK